jgi:hypothetical protein
VNALVQYWRRGGGARGTGGSRDKAVWPAMVMDGGGRRWKMALTGGPHL